MSQAEEKKMITELTDILDQDIEVIVAMRMRAERKVSRHQRAIEKVTGALGRPLAVYLIVAGIMCWVLASVCVHAFGVTFFDAPPFPWLQDVVSASALLMTVVVLTTQNRQAQLAEQRRHLDLQINLLTERKVSKVIAMLAELRYDLPSVQNRPDPEAEAMQEPVDPHTALKALNETLQEATREYELNLE